jgi:Na+/proline symporter
MLFAGQSGCRHLRADPADGFGHGWLALLVFIGGLSAATGMVIVETIALSTMVCNDLVMPLLLRYRWLALQGQEDCRGAAGHPARGHRLDPAAGPVFSAGGEAHALVSIGLISFAAVAQFAPAMIGGMYWRGGTRGGAGGVVGRLCGVALPLLLPSFAKSGWLPMIFCRTACSGWICFVRRSCSAAGLDPMAHSLFWSMLANLGPTCACR